MSVEIAYHCTSCNLEFTVIKGGGFAFDVLHCDTCGADTTVSHESIGGPHLAFVKGLPGVYAGARAGLDQQIKATYPGEPISRDEYHGCVEATEEPCRCGGTFTYDAPPRCPGCRSTEESWTDGLMLIFRD